MKKITICIVFLTSVFVIYAQKMDYGVFVGGNVNFISLHSDYNIQDETGFNPMISYNIGAFY